MTVVQQGDWTFPVGMGMGATQLECAVISLARAAGIPPIRTLEDPTLIIPGPAGTQEGREQGAVVSVTRAAGEPPISTLDCPFTMASGNAGWATGVGTGAAG